MTATTTAITNLPDEEHSFRLGGGAVPGQDDAYRRLLARLSHQSVVKHFDAYADVSWDDPACALDVTDPRFELPADDPLGETAWYRAQPGGVRARLGLHMFATFMRIGRAFEGILKRGMLDYIMRLPDDAPEMRYAYHEVIEEAQHSLMFHEFVRRTGLDVRVPRILRLGERRVVGFARSFPELFFVLVLSGEDPIDWVQRRMLQSGRALHPLLERISRIHVTEEARHMSFARHYLRRHVPNLRGHKRFLLRLRTPAIFKISAAMMMKPSAHLVDLYGIPAEVMQAAYGPGSLHEGLSLDALRKPRDLCWELGILNQRWAPLWKRLRIYAPPTA